MTRSGTNGHGFFCTLYRSMMRVLVAAVGAGILLASSSVVMSFEPTTQDEGKTAGKPGPKAKTGAGAKVSQSEKIAKKAARRQERLDAAADLKGPKLPLPDRPARTVTPPTLTSAELDRLIKQFLTATAPKVEPATLTSDVEFVRRIYFDVIGHPPTPAQVDVFIRDRAKDKRARLIDALLSTPEYARNWANYWREVISFHATNENLNRVRFDALEDWLAKRLQANTPWDTIVAGMITATGRNDENGAVALSLAHEARPVEMAGEVSRIFMGVQIQCAQCHDHKTDAWKRRQFHEFAAFFQGVQAKQVEKPAPGQPPVFAVIEKGARRYTMPELDNPAKQVPIAPRFFLASSKSRPAPELPEALAVTERRAMAASYVTGQDNPWFAKAYINRVWYVLLGEAFYEPIDDIGPEREPRAPEVLGPLAEQWQKGGYDVRWLFRTILNSDAYQRRVRSTANAAGKTPFASSCPSRLRADQVWDALVHALAIPLDSNGNFAPAQKNNGAGRGPGQGDGISKGQVRLAEKSVTKKGAAKAAEAAGLASQVGKKAGAAIRAGGQRLYFDRLFGVDPSVANEDVMGTIPQALFLMNGPIVTNRTQARPGTVLGEILSTAPNPRAALSALYLRVLSRGPTKEEFEICSRYMGTVANQAEAFEDIYWGLVNSTEFLTRR
jgi:hypothetical protein